MVGDQSSTTSLNFGVGLVNDPRFLNQGVRYERPTSGSQSIHVSYPPESTKTRPTREGPKKEDDIEGTPRVKVLDVDTRPLV